MPLLCGVRLSCTADIWSPSIVLAEVNQHHFLCLPLHQLWGCEATSKLSPRCDQELYWQYLKCAELNPESRHVGDVWPWFSSMNRHLNSLSSPEIRLQIFLLTGDFKDLCWQNHQWLLKVQAILFISCIFNSVSKDSFIVKALVYQSSLTCLRRITFHPPSSIQFSLPPDCHLMICNDCGLAAGSCRIQNILSLSNNGNII